MAERYGQINPVRHQHGVPAAGDFLWRSPGGAGNLLNLSTATASQIQAFTNGPADSRYYLFVDPARTYNNGVEMESFGTDGAAALARVRQLPQLRAQEVARAEQARTVATSIVERRDGWRVITDFFRPGQ